MVNIKSLDKLICSFTHRLNFKCLRTKIKQFSYLKIQLKASILDLHKCKNAHSYIMVKSMENIVVYTKSQ